MEASIFASILHIIGFLSLFVAIFLLPKSEKKLNGVMWLLLSLLSEMCWGTFIAALINFVHIPINIYSMGILYLCSAIALGVVIYRKKIIQKYQWDVFDIVVSIGIIVSAFAVLYYMAGPDLKLIYINSDAAAHLRTAVYLVLDQRLPGMYFAPLHTAMVLEVLMPAVPIYEFYKIFLVMDAALLAVEIILFFMFCREYLTNWKMKGIGVAMTLIYTLGYPFESYRWSFYYWGIGVMLVGFVVMLLRMYRTKEIPRPYVLFLLMIALHSVTMCYMLFGPPTYVAAFLCLAVIVKREGKLITKENFLLALKVFLIPTILAVYYCYFDFLVREGLSATEVLSREGGIYREVYVNFLWLLPLVLYLVIHALYKREFDENMIFFLVTAICVLVTFAFTIKLRMSGYYYYKSYYPLWFFLFALAIQAIEKMLKDHWEVLISYGLVLAGLFALHYWGIEAMILRSQQNLQEWDRSAEFFSIYDYNRAYYADVYETFPDSYREVCRYVVNELDGEEVPMLAVLANYQDCFWYEALTGQDSSEYYGWDHHWAKIKKKLDNKDVKYFAIYRNCPLNAIWKDYIKQFKVVYKNESGIVYSTKKKHSAAK